MRLLLTSGADRSCKEVIGDYDNLPSLCFYAVRRNLAAPRPRSALFPNRVMTNGIVLTQIP
jgi:hypothetical protein